MGLTTRYSEFYMATIYRDNLGVPHIDAINYADAVKAISYCHSEDDFYTIQILILAGRQKSGHYDDWDGPYLDMVCSFFDIEKNVDKISNISTKYLELVKAYVEGLNLYAVEHPDEILDKTVFPLAERDIIISQHLMEILGIQLDKPYSYLKDSSEIELPSKQGSNAIAIGPSKSKTGHALLALSPHQTIEGPFSYYEIHVNIESENTELHGFVLPCTFTPFMGTNFKIAWGSTASYPEMYNIYQIDVIKKFGSTPYFVLNNEKVILDKVTYRNYTKLYGRVPFPIIKTFYRSKYGSVIEINGVYYLIDIPMLGCKFGFSANYELSLCNKISEMCELLKKHQYTYLDYVAIDSNDDILYTHCSRERVRSDQAYYYLNTLPQEQIHETVDNQFYGVDNMIMICNPHNDYIISVNQSPFWVTDTYQKPDKYKGLLYHNQNSRSIRARDLIESIDRLGTEDLKDIQFDTKIIFPIIRNIDFSELFRLSEDQYKSLSHLIKSLKSWDGYATVESRGAAVFAFLFNRYKKYYRYSKNPDVIRVATKTELIDCLKWVNKHLPKDATLGDVQFLKRGKTVYPIGGVPDSLNTVRPYYEKGGLYVEESSAFRMIIDLSSRLVMTCHPLGSSSNEEDPNYVSQMKMFTNNEYKTIYSLDYYKKQYKGYTI